MKTIKNQAVVIGELITKLEMIKECWPYTDEKLAKESKETLSDIEERIDRFGMVLLWHHIDNGGSINF